jgi:hypothetical protein
MHLVGLSARRVGNTLQATPCYAPALLCFPGDGAPTAPAGGGGTSNNTTEGAPTVPGGGPRAANNTTASDAGGAAGKRHVAVAMGVQPRDDSCVCTSGVPFQHADHIRHSPHVLSNKQT